MEAAFTNNLDSIFDDRVQYNLSLKGLTSFKIGGKAAVYVSVENVNELQNVLRLVDQYGANWRIIGKGSNILIDDIGFAGIIIYLAGKFKNIQFEKVGDIQKAHVGAGVSLTSFVRCCQSKGLGGAEFLFGIPGSFGGAVIMNAGAWGGEFSDLISEVQIITEQGVITLGQEQLEFGYRVWHNWSEFSGRGGVGSVTVELKEDEPDKIRDRCKKFVKKRMSSQPKGFPNAGSFFKNPEGDSAGRLIDSCGLKGLQVGGAMVSDMHANFFVNAGDATATDVKQLMQKVQDRVKSECDIVLLPEVHFI